ncbi:MAG: TIGR03086 family protein [Ilumatobacteraceae bacterium]|nr:TIGR03086 family protein [Ilumatobacteraceae bacterium]
MDSMAFHREALDVSQHVIDAVDRSQFELPTPCDEWNVRQLLEHMIGGNRRIAGDPPADGEDLIGDDLSGAYAAAAAEAAATFEAPGGLDRTFKLSFGEVPGQLAVVARATDQLAHSWDLAKATGMSTDLSPAMYATGLEVLQQRFAKFGRNPATYADEQQPDVGASAADRFAAFAGRRT